MVKPKAGTAPKHILAHHLIQNVIIDQQVRSSIKFSASFLSVSDLLFQIHSNLTNSSVFCVLCLGHVCSSCWGCSRVRLVIFLMLFYRTEFGNSDAALVNEPFYVVVCERFVNLQKKKNLALKMPFLLSSWRSSPSASSSTILFSHLPFNDWLLNGSRQSFSSSSPSISFHVDLRF